MYYNISVYIFSLSVMSRTIETIISCRPVSSQMFVMRNKTKNTDMEGTMSMLNTENANMLLMKNAEISIIYLL